MCRVPWAEVSVASRLPSRSADLTPALFWRWFADSINQTDGSYAGACVCQLEEKCPDSEDGDKMGFFGMLRNLFCEIKVKVSQVFMNFKVQ